MAYQQPLYLTQPLPPPYNFGPYDFQALAQYAVQQPGTNQTTYEVCPIVASYRDQTQRNSFIARATPQDRAQYQAGRCVSTAANYYPATTGGIGMVTSPMQGAVGTGNDWHTVGVLRQNGTVWIYDPAYQMNSYNRLDRIPGTSNVSNLLRELNFNGQILVQGQGSQQQDCMGRTAQWVDGVINAPGAPYIYPIGTFNPGEVTLGWQAITRS